ncbi:VOC family protein [Rhizobium sp. LARHSG275]|uniref:VOC family protein n=1 Tax=Rhizobium TaxID=379 RepID=UPI001FEEE107|nr:VOC family protein [Rhizobium laguerreae]
MSKPSASERQAESRPAISVGRSKQLDAAQAHQLVEPVAVSALGSGARVLLTIKVDDVDAVFAELRKLGVTLLNGPTDRPWGRRTAAFADPSGHVWEVARNCAKACRAKVCSGLR